MGDIEITGTVCENEKQIEWKIKDFLQLEDKSQNGYKCPKFSFSDEFWNICIYPYGTKCNETVGYVNLLVYSMSSRKYSTMGITLGFKTVDKKIDLEKTAMILHDTDRDFIIFGRIQMILRSDLIQRKSELLPSGVLTVICILKNTEPSVVTERSFLDASAQTEDGKGLRKLQQHLREISLNGEVSDVILKVEDQEFKSHRCILAARSPVFSAMMRNEMKENITGVVDIQDIDPKTFSDFLKYLYTGSIEDVTEENVTKLYTIADKYQVEVLKENCLDYILPNVSIENFCDIFYISVQHNEEKLKETCIQYFGKHILDIIKTCKWQSLLCEKPIICNELLIKHVELNKNICTLHCKESQK